MEYVAALKFNGCKLAFQLEAQSPMIHFQENQSGATLRASEMKPKLDRFLLRHMCQNQELKKELHLSGEITETELCRALRKNRTYKTMFADADHPALNYKVQITESGDTCESQKVDLKKDYKIYYGNMRRGILSDPCVTILCFHEYLRTQIEQNILKFFLVTNFGGMQGKGFGSFIPTVFFENRQTLTMQQELLIADALKVESDCMLEPRGRRSKAPFQCYCIRFAAGADSSAESRQKINKDIFETIKSFYGMMKTGAAGRENQPYIYKYTASRFVNEKVWMRDPNRRLDFKKTRFIKILLGFGTFIKFRNVKKTVTIKSSSNAIERLSSPIYFKVIKNVLFISAKEIPDEVFNHKFDFTAKTDAGNRRVSLYSPGRGDFDIQAFLDSYVADYNQDRMTAKAKKAMKAGESR